MEGFPLNHFTERWTLSVSTKLTELKNVFVCRAISSKASYICLAIRKTVQEVSWPFSGDDNAARERGTKGVFPLSVPGLLGTARWDHHGDRRPHTFIPRDVSPWSYVPQPSYPTFRTRPSVRSTLVLRSSDWARSHLPPRRSSKESARIFGATRRGKATWNNPQWRLLPKTWLKFINLARSSWEWSKFSFSSISGLNIFL